MSILKLLEKNRIVSFEKQKGTSGVFVQENCDYYFCVHLSTDDVRKLANELLLLADDVENRRSHEVSHL